MTLNPFKKFRLVADWKNILRYSWSVRWTLLAGILSSIQAYIDYTMSGQKQFIAIGGALFSFGTVVVRILEQANMPNENRDPTQQAPTV